MLDVFHYIVIYRSLSDTTHLKVLKSRVMTSASKIEVCIKVNGNVAHHFFVVCASDHRGLMLQLAAGFPS